MGDVTIGYWYGFDIHMGLCRGAIDSLREIRVGDKRAWYDLGFFDDGFTVTGKGSDPDLIGVPDVAVDRIGIFAPNLFGGEKREGGINGWAVLMQDTVAYPDVSPQLADMHGTPTPKFKGVTSLLFSGWIGSMNPYPKPWAFRIRRTHGGWNGSVWYPDKCRIQLGEIVRPDYPETPSTNEELREILAMNPAHILYQTLTDPDWGRGLDPAMLDDASYRAAADTLYAEGFGLCLLWSKQVPIADFMQGVLDHIGAVQSVNRQTGLMTLRLIRDDYVVADLPLFDYESGLLGVDEISTGSASDAVNEVIVKYFDPRDKMSQTVRVTNLASIQTIGVVSETIEYPGISTPDLAARVAQRDLRAKSGLIKRFKIRLDRRAYTLEPGSIFRLSAPDFGIGEIVLRAGRVEDGTLLNGVITVTAIQDVFALSATSYATVQPTAWQPPALQPVPIINKQVVELSYQQIISRADAAQIALLEDTMCFAGAIAQKPSPLTMLYYLQTRVGANDFSTRYDGDFVATAVLLVQAEKDTTVLHVEFSNDAKNNSIVANSAVLINGEVCRITAGDFVAGTITLARGCIDTVPAVHAANSIIWFYHTNLAIDPTEYSAGTSLDVRCIPQTSSAVLNPADADIDTVIFSNRFGRPYPPGKFRIDGLNAPQVAIGNVVVTWSHRNRIVQADQLIDTEIDSISPEAGTTYTVRLLNAADMTVLDAVTGETGSTATLSASINCEAIIELWAVRDGLDSWQKHSHAFVYLTEQPRVTASGELRLTADGNIRIVE